MFGFGSNRDKAQVGFIQKMNQTIQNAIQNLFKIRWSALPRRAPRAYLDLFHTSPRLDALDMIATDCANAVFKVYRKIDLRTGREDAIAVEDHPAYELLENPIPDHPEFDGFMVRYLTVVYLELNGECFWIILRDVKGRPREIYPVPSQWCIQTPTASQPWYLIVPLQNTAGASMQVDPRDVVWFKSPDANSPYGRGRGRTEAIGDELETDEYAAKWAKNLYWNNATPEAYMTMPGASDVQLKAFKAAWNDSHQGIMNAHKMGFLNFDSKLVQVQTTPKELDFNESRRFLRDIINQHWRIPPEMMGITENSNRSTIESADYLYKKNVVSPRVIRWETAVNRQLMPMFGSTDYAIKCDNLVPEDKEFNLKVATEGWSSGALSRDQWLIMNGKQPVGGDFGAQYLVPYNMVATSPGGAIKNVTPAPVAITEEDQESGAVEPNDGADDISRPVSTTMGAPVLDTPTAAARPIEDDSSKGLRKKAFTAEQRQTIWKAFDKTAESTENIFEASVKRFAGTQKAAYQKAFNMQMGKGKSVRGAADIATTVVFNAKIDEALKTSLTPGWLASMKAGEDHAISVLGKKKGKSARKDGVSGAFDVSNPRFLEWIQKNGLEKAKGINDTTLGDLKKKLQDALAADIEEGASEREMAKTVMTVSDGVWDDMDSTRAHMIARTESASTVNYGTKETYKAEGVKSKEWVAVQDDRTRDSHAEADGQVVAIDDDFTVDGEGLQYPGDPSASPELSINCRCAMVPVIDEGDA